MDASDWLLVVASVVLGQFALLGIEWLRSNLDRRQRRQDRSDDFQQETLIELQDALYNFVLGVNMLRDSTNRELAGQPHMKWAALGDPGEMTQVTGPRIAVLRERVRDGELRRIISDVMVLYSYALPNSRNITEVDESFAAMHNAQLAANERIGELLRAL